jgi:hypothetical protein
MQIRVLTFQSIHHVLKAEKLLLKAGFKLDIIPTPKNISSDCGMSIRTNCDNAEIEIIRGIMEENEFIFAINEII